MKDLNYDKELLIIDNYIKMDRFSQALDRLANLMEEKFSDAYLIYLYAYCLYRLDKYDEAISSCKDAFENGYNEEECYYLLGRIYIERDQYEEAEKFLLSALEVNPEEPEILACYGYLMMLRRKNYRALELINEALRIDPENLSALHYKFYYYLYMDDTNGIKSGVIEKYFSLAANDSDRFLKAGMLDYHSYNYDSAESNFIQAFQLDPTNKFILKMLERVNQKPRFLFHWKRLLKKFIRNRLAIIRLRLKTKWILFKCVGLTPDTLIIVIVPFILLMLIVITLIIIL